MDRATALHYARCILRIIFVTLNNLYCIPTYTLWMILLRPLFYWKPEVYWFIEAKIFHWLLTIVASWSWSAGYTIEEVGDDISACYNQECLLVVNHQSTADVPILMAAFQNKASVIPNMMWLMDKHFKYTNFGLVSIIHGDFFIQSGKDIRENQLQSLRDHLINVYWQRHRRWLVLFPEGGFLRKRLATSQRYGEKNNLPHLELVSLPRLGAMQTIITTLNPVEPEAAGTKPEEDFAGCRENCSPSSTSHSEHNQRLPQETDKKQEPLKWVIDVTVGYPDQEPLCLATICAGSRPTCVTTLHYRRYPIEDVPTEMQELTNWLYDRWVEKERMLETFYKTGRFPDLPSSCSKKIVTPRPVVLSNMWIVVYHLFFISSTLFHIYLLRSLWRVIF